MCLSLVVLTGVNYFIYTPQAEVLVLAAEDIVSEDESLPIPVEEKAPEGAASVQLIEEFLRDGYQLNLLAFNIKTRHRLHAVERLPVKHTDLASPPPKESPSHHSNA